MQASSFSGTTLKRRPAAVHRGCAVKTQALFSKKKQADSGKAKPKQQKERGQSVLEAFDFSKTRSKEDAKLLYDARYGKRGEDGRMTKEQYQALRRKVGGTAKDYFKDWVEVQGDYTDQGYVSRGGSSVPGLPFLIAVVVALFGALGYVVSQTS